MLRAPAGAGLLLGPWQAYLAQCRSRAGLICSILVGSEPRGCLRARHLATAGRGPGARSPMVLCAWSPSSGSVICPLHEVCQAFLLNGRESCTLTNWFKFEAVIILTCLLQGWTASVNSRDFRNATIQKFL